MVKEEAKRSLHVCRATSDLVPLKLCIPSIFQSSKRRLKGPCESGKACTILLRDLSRVRNQNSNHTFAAQHKINISSSSCICALFFFFYAQTLSLNSIEIQSAEQSFSSLSFRFHKLEKVGITCHQLWIHFSD